MILNSKGLFRVNSYVGFWGSDLEWEMMYFLIKWRAKEIQNRQNHWVGRGLMGIILSSCAGITIKHCKDPQCLFKVIFFMVNHHHQTSPLGRIVLLDFFYLHATSRKSKKMDQNSPWSWLDYILDEETYPVNIGIMVSHWKDPYEPTSIRLYIWNVRFGRSFRLSNLVDNRNIGWKCCQHMMKKYHGQKRILADSLSKMADIHPEWRWGVYFRGSNLPKNATNYYKMGPYQLSMGLQFHFKWISNHL